MGRDPTFDEEMGVIFETQHSFNPSEKELREMTQCPFCDGFDTEITMLGANQTVFVRGHDWTEFRKNNATSLRRDMALHQLQTADPYKEYRQAGEADDLAHRLKTGPKTKPKVFDMS